MTPIDFIFKIKQVVYQSAVKGSVALLQKPPGRKPSSELRALSKWYNQLGEPDKEMVYSVIKLAAKQTTFGMLAVLDGVRQIDENNPKGVLELYYTKDSQKVLLNDPNVDNLHELFNRQVPPS